MHTKRALQYTERALQYTERALQYTERALQYTERALQYTERALQYTEDRRLLRSHVTSTTIIGNTRLVSEPSNLIKNNKTYIWTNTKRIHVHMYTKNRRLLRSYVTCD